MPTLTPAQAKELAERARDLLGDAARLTDGSQGEYIRDGNPASPFDAIPLAMARQGCRRYAEKGGNYPPLRAARAERACRPYLDSLNYNDGPVIDKPFDGGQCPVDYNVTFSQTDYNTDGSVASTAGYTQTYRGPLGPIRHTTSGCGPVIGPLAPGAMGFCAFMSTGTGNQLIAGNGNGGTTVTVVSVSRVDALPDNCGELPPEYFPPKLPPSPDPPGPVPYVRPPDIDIDIDIDVDVDGPITIDIGTGPITIDPFGDGDGDGGDGDGGDPGDPTDPGSPGDSEGTGAGGEAEGQAPPGQELVGLLVTVTEAPGDANKFANNPRQPFRGIGYVRMGYPGRLGLDISGGTVISPQFFHAQQRGLTNWAVAANTGFDLTVQPYYRDIET